MPMADFSLYSRRITEVLLFNSPSESLRNVDALMVPVEDFPDRVQVNGCYHGDLDDNGIVRLTKNYLIPPGQTFLGISQGNQTWNRLLSEKLLLLCLHLSHMDVG